MTNRAFKTLMETGEYQLKGWQVNELQHFELRLRQVGLDARYEDTVLELMKERIEQMLKESE